MNTRTINQEAQRKKQALHEAHKRELANKMEALELHYSRKGFAVVDYEKASEYRKNLIQDLLFILLGVLFLALLTLVLFIHGNSVYNNCLQYAEIAGYTGEYVQKTCGAVLFQ